MNKYKVGYIVTNVLDYILTFGGTIGVIACNYIDKENSVGYKISLTGIILLIATLYFCKAVFEKRYQAKHNDLLQQLSTVTDPLLKDELNKKLNSHKLMNEAYQRATAILPLVILYLVTLLGARALDEMNGTLGMMLLFVCGGAVCDVAKIPLKDKASMIALETKAKK